MATPVERKEDCFVFGYSLPEDGYWLHLDYSFPDIVPLLEELGVEHALQEVLLQENPRPTTMRMGKSLIVILRGINLNPGADPEDMVSVRMFIEPGRIVTIRQRRLMSVQAARDKFEKEGGPENYLDVLETIVGHMGERAAEFVDQVENSLESLELDSAETRGSKIKSELRELKRQILIVRRYLAPQREALEGLVRHFGSVVQDDVEMGFVFRSHADGFIRLIEDLDLMREKIASAQEEMMNRVIEEQNARMYALSIVAAIFLPITFVTGIFGMNVAGLPGTDEPAAFLMVAASMAVVSVGVIVFFRMRGWL